MASGHSATGALMGGLAAPLLPSPLAPAAAVALGMLGGAYLALVMDLDTKGKCYHLLVPFSWLLKPLLVTVSKVLFALTRGPDDPEETNGHRMFTHQPVFAGLLALSVLWWRWDTDVRWFLAGLVFVGVWAHRAGDACTEHGVPPGLIHVIIRKLSGETKVWATVGIPRRLRFVTGGGKGRKTYLSGKPWRTAWRDARRPVVLRKRPSKRLTFWDRTGEGVVTLVLAGLCVVLMVVTMAGFYPLVLT